MSTQRFPLRSSLSTALVLAFALLFGAAPALAQSEGQPAYAKKFNEAKNTAKQAQQAEKAGNVDEAVSQYEAAYREFANVADMAQNEGSVENANLAKRLSAQLAYRAGRLLYTEDRSQEAVEHFEFGQQVAPPSYTKNTKGLRAARNSVKQGPVVDASRALHNGNAREALQLLSEVEEQNGTTYFYQALAQQQLANSASAVSYAQRSLDAGGLSSSKQGQLYLIIGEEQMKQGDKEAARSALQRAAQLGSPQASQRAKALLEQL